MQGRTWTTVLFCSDTNMAQKRLGFDRIWIRNCMEWVFQGWEIDLWFFVRLALSKRANHSFKKSKSLLWSYSKSEKIDPLILLYSLFFNERQERKSEFPALAQVLWVMGLIWPQSISMAWALKLEFFSRNGAWSLVEGPTSVGLSRNLIVFVFSGKNFKNLYFHFIKKYDEIQKKCCSPWKCKRYKNLARIFSYRFLALPPLTAALLWVPQLCFIEDLWVKTNDKTRKHRLLEERI